MPLSKILSCALIPLCPLVTNVPGSFERRGSQTIDIKTQEILVQTAIQYMVVILDEKFPSVSNSGLG